MIRYSSGGMHNCGHDAINEFKLLIREAHKRGIEVATIAIWFSICFCFFEFSILILLKQVVMDVVFNHTAEGNEKGPILSFRGVDNSVFYMLAPKVCLLKALQYVSASLGKNTFGEFQ